MSSCVFRTIVDSCRNWIDVSLEKIIEIKIELTTQTLSRFGVVVAFVTNSYLQQGVENATTTARHGADDTQKFLKTTSLQVNHLLVTNYDELSTHLGDMLSGTNIYIIDPGTT